MDGSVKVQGNSTAMTIAWARWKAALSNASAGSRGAYGLYKAGLEEIRVELILKGDGSAGKSKTVGWIRTIWHPVLGRVPEDRRQQFISEMAEGYLERHPLDRLALLDKMRLDVGARRPHI